MLCSLTLQTESWTVYNRLPDDTYVFESKATLLHRLQVHGEAASYLELFYCANSPLGLLLP